MSRTARCVFALGLSVSLAAACGDDDGDTTNIGGSGGGGSGGRAGNAGSAGRGGAAGTAGTAGRGGNAGTGGAAGTQGTVGGTGGGGAGGTAGAAGTAGTGGTGGTGGSEEPDAGADAAVTDAGVELAACPADLDDLQNGPTGDATTSTVSQEVIITRLVFDGANVAVTFKGILAPGFDFGDPLLLCTGSEPEDCDDAVQALVGTGPGNSLAPGEQVTVTTPLGDIVTAASGEIALVNGLPTSPDAGNPEPIVRAYVNWGNYVSLEPSTGNLGTLEERADDENVWTLDSSIDVAGNTTIFAADDVVSADGFGVCTAD